MLSLVNLGCTETPNIELKHPHVSMSSTILNQDSKWQSYLAECIDSSVHYASCEPMLLLLSLQIEALKAYGQVCFNDTLVGTTELEVSIDLS